MARLGPLALVVLAMIGGSIGSLITVLVLDGRNSPAQRSSETSLAAPQGTSASENEAVPPGSIGANRRQAAPPVSAPSPSVVTPALAPSTEPADSAGPDSSVSAKGSNDVAPSAATAVVGATALGMPADGLVVISRLSGWAKARDPETGWRQVLEGHVLREGESIFAYDRVTRTKSRLVEEEGELELRVNGNSFVRVAMNTGLQLVKVEPVEGSGQRTTRFVLTVSYGRVWVNDAHGPAARTALRVRSGVMEVAANGAQFQLMLSRDGTETMRVRNYAGSLTATLTDSQAKQTLTPGMHWDVPLRGMWPPPTSFDIAEDEKDPWVARNRQLDASL